MPPATKITLATLLSASLLPLTALPAETVEQNTGVTAETSPASRFPDTLTGNWGGFRDRLADRGVTFDLSFTEYYQGLFAGDGQDDWEFGSRVDAFLNVDTGKLGLWSGGGLHTHVESRFGAAPGSRAGALWPVSTGLALPLGDKGDIVATSIYFSQQLGDAGRFMLGKINAVDLLAGDPFFGGWGRDRFQNVAFVAPPSGVLPPTIMGAVLGYRLAPVSITFMVFDPHDRTDDYWPDDLFSDGANFSLGVAWSGKIAGRATGVSLTGIYSTKDSADLGEILLPPELKTGVKNGSYNVALGFSHLLYESPSQPGKGFGVYARGAIADGNPNPIQAFFAGGLAGHGVVPGRPRDNFGIGYFYYSFSDDLQSAVAPLERFDDEQGLEIFYNFALTPWFRVTADLQVIDPATGANATVVVGGLRANIAF